MATIMTWFSARLWVHEEAVRLPGCAAKTYLELRAVELSGDIANFLRERGRTAPPRPQPATWDRDEITVLRYEQETAALFEAEFGAQVRTTREMFAQRRLIDRDLDAFYRRPSTAFEIGVVARRLAVLAHRLERS